MSKKNKKINLIILSLVAGIIFTLGIGSVVSSERPFPYRSDSITNCPPASANDTTETSWGFPFKFTKITATFCGEPVHKWLPQYFLLDIAIFTALSFLVLNKITQKKSRK